MAYSRQNPGVICTHSCTPGSCGVSCWTLFVKIAAARRILNSDSDGVSCSRQAFATFKLNPSLGQLTFSHHHWLFIESIFKETNKLIQNHDYSWLPGPEGVVVIVVAIPSTGVVIGQLGTNQVTVQKASRASDQNPSNKQTGHQSKFSEVLVTNTWMGRSHLTWPLRSEIWLLGELGGAGKHKGHKIWPLVMGEGVDEELLLGNGVAAQRLPGPHGSSVVQSGAPPPSHHCYHVTFWSNDVGDADL